MDKYIDYPKKVVNGDIVACEYVRLACQKYLDWFSRGDLEFRPDAVDKVVNFISKLRHFTGAHNGKRFELLPYQFWIICNIFGWYHKGTNKRVKRYVYIELARKSGKSTFAAAISLYMLIADGENGSECEFVANSRKQASIMFDMASNLISSIDPKGKYFKRYRDKIKFDTTKSFLQVLSSDAGGNDGYNAYCFVLDEVHEAPDSKLWDVMCSSQGMRENPLAIMITTAGFNVYGFCYQYRENCIEILKGIKEDDSQFTAIYTQDPEDDIKNPEVWIKSNPSLGQTVSRDYLEIQTRKADNNPSETVGIVTKNFNVWCQASGVWIPGDVIMDLTSKIDLKDLSGKYGYIGIDLAATSDMTALSLLVPDGDKCIFKNWYFLPESCLSGNSNSELYKDWKKKGYLITTPGKTTDYDYVLKKLLEIKKDINLIQVSYDKYNATQFNHNAISQGLPMVEYSQSILNFSQPTKDFEKRILDGKVIIDNNPITRWCFGNVELKEDFNSNVKPIKTVAQKKIDGVIAMIQALGGYLDNPIQNGEIYTFNF